MKKKAITLLFIISFLILAGCAESEIQESDLDQEEQLEAARQQDREEERIKKEEQALAKEKRDEELKKQRINPEYQAYLKTNRCETKYWSRYEFGKYFQEIADRNKITAYDVIYGDSYTRRNIASFVWSEINENFSKYIVYHMPEPIQNKFNQEFTTKQEKDRNKKSVFNISIKRDYECYKKLK